MNIYIADSYKDYTIFTAKHILNFLEKKQEKKEKLYISVSSQYDAKDIYSSIIENIGNYKINVKNIFIFQQSEYIGLSPNDKNSKAYFLKENLISKIDIPKENVFLFDGKGSEYQMDKQLEIIQEMGRFDVIWYSLTADSTSAGNERMSSLSSLFRIKTLSEHSINEIKYKFEENNIEVPTTVFSMGMGFIDIVDTVLLTSSGIENSCSLRDCLEHGISNSSPLSKLQKHSDVTVIADYESSLRLSRQTVFMKI
ncbi:glucosamine-6-phosphate isomerase [uncultured Brachyspira sp.]|uniref:glucosamine-6-phosphate isomerase n=1 Tax=uncultured Brachyspira sp. TaxID=221953 RepID=UPI0025E21782|nr:glucosamine-6-phosphate isomerase [uncultured Brachyspira sp.]